MESTIAITNLELPDLRPDPGESWQHLQSFVQLGRKDQQAMQQTVEPVAVIAAAMAGWHKYLLVQLHLMEMGYEVARDLDSGSLGIPLTFYGRLRSLLERSQLTVHVAPGDTLATVLAKLFNYYPQIRGAALDRRWLSEGESESLWLEVVPIYRPKKGWRVLLNGGDSS